MTQSSVSGSAPVPPTPKSPPTTVRHRYISLRVKLLVGFSVVFSGVFAGAFYWFYSFTTDKTMERMRTDLNQTAQGAADGIDVEELMDFYATGTPNIAGFSDDPRYRQQMEWLQQVNSLEPRAWPFTYVVIEDAAEDIRQVATPDIDLPFTIYLTDLWANYDVTKAGEFLGIGNASPATLTAYRTGEIAERELYSDEFGSWISAYVPLTDDNGQVVAMLGVDFQADYVRNVQAAIRGRVFVAFAITYGLLFGLVYLVSGIVSRPVRGLTIAAEEIGEGRYHQNLSVFWNRRFPDEIGKLANVLEKMTQRIQARENKLKQQVADLKIEIDHSKRSRQVQEIVETDFFQDLVGKAKDIRNRGANSTGNSSAEAVAGSDDVAPDGSEKPPNPDTEA
jgi:methyl-accepting chemotaxis protein